MLARPNTLNNQFRNIRPMPGQQQMGLAGYNQNMGMTPIGSAPYRPGYGGAGYRMGGNFQEQQMMQHNQMMMNSREGMPPPPPPPPPGMMGFGMMGPNSASLPPPPPGYNQAMPGRELNVPRY
jgi:hypothetical protein